MYKVGCKIDVIYVIERCYYTRNYINDINGFFADLTEGLKNDTSGVDLKVAYVIYDSDIDYEEAFTSNLTKVKEELEKIPKSFTTSYYAERALEYAYYEFVKLKNGKRSDADTYYVLLSAYKSSSYPASGIGATIRMFPKNKMFAVGKIYIFMWPYCSITPYSEYYKLPTISMENMHLHVRKIIIIFL